MGEQQRRDLEETAKELREITYNFIKIGPRNIKEFLYGVSRKKFVKKELLGKLKLL